MEGIINNFRLGRTTKSGNQMVVVVSDIDSKDKADKLVGKKVVYKTESGKEIGGEIRSSHGNKGALRVLFETGMPGQAIGKKVNIQG